MFRKYSQVLNIYIYREEIKIKYKKRTVFLIVIYSFILIGKLIMERDIVIYLCV